MYRGAMLLSVDAMLIQAHAALCDCIIYRCNVNVRQEISNSRSIHAAVDGKFTVTRYSGRYLKHSVVKN